MLTISTCLNFFYLVQSEQKHVKKGEQLFSETLFQALAAEQRALLSAGTSSSSSQSNETSEDLTPDLGTLDSSPTSPEAYYNVSYSKINNCRMFEGEDLAEVTPPTLKYSDDLEYEVKDSIVYSDDRNGGSKLDAHNSNTDGQNTENSSKLSENDVRSEIPPHHPKHTYC